MDYLNNWKTKIYARRTQRKYPHIWSRYCELSSRKEWSYDELQEYNFRKRCELVRFAYEHTKFYHKLYSSVGFEPNDLKTEADWQNLPIVTKTMFKNTLLEDGDRECLSSEGIGSNLRRTSTGGSTGEPFSFYKDKRAILAPVRWRSWNILGLGFGQNIGYVCRPEMYPKKNFRERLEMWPMRYIWLNANTTTPDSMDLFIRQYKRVKPAYVLGYVGAINELAIHIVNSGIQLPPPCALVTTASPLTKEKRKNIEEAFGVNVCNMYSCSECNNMALQCLHQIKRADADEFLHINSDVRHIDVLDEKGRPVPFGVEGIVYATDLENKVFPFIRYCLNDRSFLSEKRCECGLPFPLMGSVKGREKDIVYTKSGLQISALDGIFYQYADVFVNYQIRQKSDYSIVVYLVPNKKCVDIEGKRQEILRTFKKELQDDTPVSLEICEVIPHDKGKLRPVISDVKV